MLQEIIANAVGAELGFYKHAVGAMHLYVKDTGPAKRFLREGFQKTTPIMQSMPKGGSVASCKASPRCRNGY
jgi:thymidylate synthase